jgi:hypothetical protein
MSGDVPGSLFSWTHEDADLYCLACGYNLRGLSGDPRRCPECGHLNPLGDMELPAELITQQLRRMETAPAACVGVILVLAFCLFQLAYGVVSAPKDFDAFSILCCLGIPLVVGLVAWAGCAGSFSRSCLGKPGWADVLWHYHLYGLGSCGFVAVGYLLANILAGKLSRSSPETTAFLIKGAVLLGWTMVVLVLILWLGPRLRAKAREEMDVLQREVAVAVAREVLRTALSKSHSEWGTKRKL